MTASYSPPLVVPPYTAIMTVALALGLALLTRLTPYLSDSCPAEPCMITKEEWAVARDATLMDPREREASFSQPQKSTLTLHSSYSTAKVAVSMLTLSKATMVREQVRTRSATLNMATSQLVDAYVSVMIASHL